MRPSPWDIPIIQVFDELLGVTLDSSLSFDRHITEVCRSCHFHIRALRHIRPLLTNDHHHPRFIWKFGQSSRAQASNQRGIGKTAIFDLLVAVHFQRNERNGGH